MEERQHGDVLEHRHENYDYWHPATRVHSESTRDELPTGHVLSKKPLAEKLILDLVPVTPIQKMSIGATLEIGAVQSLVEGLEHHRYAASTLIEQSFKDFDNGSSAHYGALFYAEWQPNHNDITHRYLIEVSGEDVFLGYFPYDGRKPRLYGIHHKKQDVIKFLHKTNDPTLQIPELTLLAELNIPNISFVMWNTQTDVSHKQGTFYTRSFYGEFISLLSSEIRVKEGETTPEIACNSRQYHYIGYDETTKETIFELIDSSGYSMSDPKHPYYIFQGATGYVQLFEGKIFCYPDGSIRFLTKEQEQDIFRGYIDLQIVQGDLVAYELEGHTVPEPQPIGVTEYNIDRHYVRVGWVEHPPEEQLDENDVWHDVKPNLLKYFNLDGLYIHEDCTLTITHPDHGETKYEALKGEMLTLLPGTSRPFHSHEGRD